MVHYVLSAQGIYNNYLTWVKGVAVVLLQPDGNIWHT